MDVIIVSGLCGAGRTMAADCLEDLGYYCVDNMPPALLSNFVTLCEQGTTPIEKACFVIDARGGEFFNDFKASLEALREKEIKYQILFLEASDAVLVRRYKASRREHPMARGGKIEEGIARDRAVMSDIRSMANHVIDTSNMKQVNLNETIQSILNPDRSKNECTITVESFGYKHGIPLDADVVFDMRFLPNPFYVPSLKDKTGNNKQVQDYVLKAPEATVFLDEMMKLTETLVPAYVREGKYNLVLCFGCTGGQHRSVAMANAFSDRLEEAGRRVIRIHRDL